MEIIWLSYLPLYIQLCEEKSISATAQRLGCSNAHVSRQLVKLENLLNKQLIHRTTRQFVVTQDGLEFYHQAKALMEHAEAIENKLFNNNVASGRVKISASSSFGAGRLSSLLAEFNTLYPRIEIELLFTEQMSDLVQESFDIAVYLTDTPPEGLVGHKMKAVTCAPYALDTYIEQHGIINHPAELNRYQHIIYKSEILNLDNWTFVKDESNQEYEHTSKITQFNNRESCNIKLDGSFKTNLIPSMVEAMLAGIGVATLADFALDKLTKSERNRVVRLLPQWRTTAILPLYILYPRREHLPKRTQLVIEFLKNRLKA
ncbi:LysR family transcriptional regulator [Shewanella nanhaiensis]|uniref:LysR family transcriptional regulator n=1 Tax=Shewanella nanhaiensis TaxID=2864872 RepID=A0ABS7E9G3_9GAMM|nr:LysR family transcriptional regulator [Shewanella nanhaiensis]MBW8186326.1 LysR family transcriptional regulator [Shewanella nanhaiensis]